MTTALNISRLLAVPGEDSDLRRHLRLQVGDDPGVTAAELLHGLVTSSDMPQGQYPGEGVPCTVAEVSGILRPLTASAEQMADLLATVCCTELAYRSLSRAWSIHEAHSACRAVVELLGDQARWWTNTHFPGEVSGEALDEGGRWWDPVTTFVFDLALVGISADATVVVVSGGLPLNVDTGFRRRLPGYLRFSRS
ncbi:hypothetical protein ACGFNU_34835 [Spirillospora sp. NPDC048911]|uniref:hypothetical protein n=1 Tax=Spirillospora sp. NPDC048911 TaxID=3364527 RepID=UPI003713B3C3